MNKQVLLLLALLTSFYINSMEQPEKEDAAQLKKVDDRNLYSVYMSEILIKPLFDLDDAIRVIKSFIMEINERAQKNEDVHKLQDKLAVYLQQIELNGLEKITNEILNDKAIDADSFSYLFRVGDIEWFNYYYLILGNAFNENHELRHLVPALYSAKNGSTKSYDDLKPVDVKTDKLRVVYYYFILLVANLLNEDITQINEKLSEYYENLGSCILHDIINILIKMQSSSNDPKFRLYSINTELNKFVSGHNLQDEFKEELEKVSVTGLPQRSIKKYTRKK